MKLNTCGRCGPEKFSGWTEAIERVVYHSGRGGGSRAVEMQGDFRMCRVCGSASAVARAFERALPKGFAWTACVVHFKGGRRMETMRLLREG